MAQSRAPLEFDVEGLGRFAAQRRTIRTQIAIERKFAAEVGADPDGASQSLRVIAGVYADLSVLLVKIPEGFSLEEADVDDAYKIFAAMRAAEERFRGAVAAEPQTAGEGA